MASDKSIFSSIMSGDAEQEGEVDAPETDETDNTFKSILNPKSAIASARDRAKGLPSTKPEEIFGPRETPADKLYEQTKPVSPLDEQILNTLHRTFARGMQSFAKPVEAMGIKAEFETPTQEDIGMLGGEAMFPSEAPAVLTPEQRASVEDDFKANQGEMLKAAKAFQEWLPQVPENKTTGAVKVFDDMMGGMADYIDVMVGASVSKLASMPLSYMTMLPDKFNGYVDGGVDREHAFFIADKAALALGSVESLSTAAQVTRIGNAFKKPAKHLTAKLKKESGALGQFLSAIGKGARDEGLEEFTQGELELFFDVWAFNKDKSVKEKLKIVFDTLKNPEFQAGVAYGTLLGAGGGGSLGAGGHVLGKAFQHISGRNKDVETDKDYEAEVIEDGVTLIKPKPDTEGGAEIGELDETAKPSVEQLLGVDDTTRAPADTEDGVSLSNDLNTTTDQTRTQIETSNSIKAVIEQVATQEGMEKATRDIRIGEEKLENLQGFYEGAVLDEDHQFALQVAQMMQAEAEGLASNYLKLSDNYAQYLDQKDLQPDVHEFTEIQTHVQNITTKAAEAVQAQTTAVNNQRIQEQQAYIDTLGTTKGLEAELISASVQATRDGKNTTAKLYNSVTSEMKQQEVMGQRTYFDKTPIKKLIDLKNAIGRQAFADRSQGEDANVLARNNAMEAWVDQQLLDYQDHTQAQLEIERAQLEARVKAPTEIKEQPQVRPHQRETFEERQEARAKREREAPKAVAAATKTREIQAEARGKKDIADVKTKAATVAEKRKAVQDQRAKLRKPVAGTTRAKELEEAKTAKAKRASDIKKQVERVEGLERPKTPIKKGKATVKDLKKDSTNFVILTSDNPGTTATPEQNVKNRVALKKKLDDLGIDYTMGKSKFKGLDEVPFIIHNMSRAEGKKLADSLGQSSFIVAEGGKVHFVEGEDVDTRTRKSMKLAPDATDDYTELAGQKFKIPFFEDTEVDLGKLTKEEIDAMSFEDRARAVLGPDASQADVTKLAKQTEELTKRADSLAQEMGMTIVDFDTMPLDQKVGTLEIMEDMKSKMKTGPFSFLFKKTKAGGTKTIFVTAPGQYGKLQEVIRTFPNLKARDDAINRFELLRGVYLPGENVTIMNLPGIAKNAQELGVAFETVVHEHVHAAHKLAFESMSEDEQQAFGKELKNVWLSIDPNWLREQRDDPSVHKRIRAGINQVNADINELVSYSMAHPEFASWLNSIPASPRFRAISSKIKTVWDALVDLVLKRTVKAPATKLDEVADVLNRHLKLSPVEVADAPAGVTTQDSAFALREMKAKGFESLEDHPMGMVQRTDLIGIADKAGIGLEVFEMADSILVDYLDIPADAKGKSTGILRKLMAESKALGKPIAAQIVNEKLVASIDKRGLDVKKLEDIGVTEIRFSKEDALLSFDFGANLNPETLRDWITEIDAPQAANTMVVKDAKEFEEHFGFAPDPEAPAVWIDAQKAKKEKITVDVLGKVVTPAVPALPMQVVFIADRIHSQEDFVFRYMHEQAGHVGLRNLFGENKVLLNRFLDNAYSLFLTSDAELLNQTIETYDIGRVDKHGKRILKSTDKRYAADEVIATKAARLKPGTKKGLLKRFREFLTKWLPAKFVARVVNFKMTDGDLQMVLEASREAVFSRSTALSKALNKAVQARRPTHKFPGWEKLPNFMFSDEEYMEFAKLVIKETPEAKEWYEQHVELMTENFGKDAEIISVLLAKTSPQADVETNVIYAIKSYLWLLNKTDKVGHRFPKKFEEDVLSQWTNKNSFLKTIESKNFKVTEFLRALLGDTSATVGDIWMYRLFFGDHAVHNQSDENPRVSQQVALRQKLHDLSQRLTSDTGVSWSPRDLQAALWVYVNAKTTGKDFSQVATFKSGFNKPTQVFNGKTPLEMIHAVVPNVSEGPLSQQIGLTETIDHAPISTLRKKNILALKREGVPGKYVVKADGTIRAINPGMENSDIVRMIDAIVSGGTRVTAPNQQMADWYQKVYGFEVIDGLDMKLSDNAISLYTNEAGNTTITLVRDNLGGFENVNFSRSVRYSKEANKNLDKIINMSQENINIRDAEFIRTGNDKTSVLNKIHEWRDAAAQNVDRFTAALEQELLEKFGGRKSKIIGFGSGRRLNTADTELLQKAMNLYIDSGTGKNLEKVKAYIKKLAAIGLNNLTGKQYQQLDIMERMLALTEEERAWADANIRPYYEDFFSFAQEHNLIDSHVDNYVKRMWKRPKKLEGDTIVWSGGTTAGFKLVTDSGKQRSFDSIVDGWEADMQLQAEGVIPNLQAYANEIGYTFANRKFVDYMRSMIDFKTDGLMFEVDPRKNPDFRPGPNYRQITMPGFAKPFHKLFAEKELANQINRLGRTASSQIWDVPFVKFLRRINSSIKSTLLSVSLFHHLAGMRSYSYGVSGVHVNGIKAYKEGLKKIAEQTEFTDDNLKKLGPMIDFLVKEGLTLGKTQDWDEAAMQESFLEDFLSERTGRPARKLLEAWQYARRRKRAFTTGLFNRLFAGLKAESASMEFIHSVKKQEKKLDRHLNDAELKLTAQQVATLINADFGGLHLARMGRNPDLQRVAQLLLLAPDWTESNWRTVTGMVPGLNAKINKLIGDNPEVPGMDKVYRRFWGGIAVKGLLSVALAQAGILALFATDDERDEYWDFWKAQFKDAKSFAKGRWISIDFTPITRKLGIGDPEKRQVFSLLGHFKDVLKIGDPWSLIKHKISPAVKLVESGVTLTDWKGSRFTTIQELIERGELSAEEGKFADKIEGINMVSQIPSWAAYNLRGALPIPIGEVFQAVQGESSALASGHRMIGLDLRDVTHVPEGQRKYEEINAEINELEKALRDAQLVRDRRMIVEARKDIKRYDGFNKKKSRIGLTRAQLRPINREIKKLELKAETTDKGLTTREEQKLVKLKAKRDKVYAKFLKVIER
jgi:hypothetical protein